MDPIPGPGPAVAQPAPQSQAAPITGTARPRTNRQAILGGAIRSYTIKGYRVLDRTETTAQLIQDKKFSGLFALLWFLVFGIGIVIYLIYYAAKRDTILWLEVDGEGQIHTAKSRSKVAVIAAIVTAVLVLSCVALCLSAALGGPVVEEIDEALGVKLPTLAVPLLATDTPTPTETPAPALTPRPTNTPTPTDAPIPTDTPVPTPKVARLEIVEVNKQREYVDIHNAGGAAQNLTDWILVSEKGNQQCKLAGNLGPGASLRVWAMLEDAGQGGWNCGYETNIWNNSERDTAILYNAQGQEVDRK